MVRKSYINQRLVLFGAFWWRLSLSCLLASLLAGLAPFGVAVSSAEALQGKEKVAAPLKLPSADFAADGQGEAFGFATSEESKSDKVEANHGENDHGENNHGEANQLAQLPLYPATGRALNLSGPTEPLARAPSGKLAKDRSLTPIKLPAAPEGSNGFTDSLVQLEAQGADEGGKHTFFKKGAATDFFGAEVSLRDPDKVSILNSQRVNELNDLSKNGDQSAKDYRASLNPDEQSLTKGEMANSGNPPSSPEEVLARFGDPDQEPRIKPEQNAPDSYKGLLAALEVGDDALAYRYARQYVRYQRNLNERVKKLTELSRIALERDGLIPAADDDEDPNYELSNKIADSIENSGKAANVESGARRVQLDKQTQELLRIAQSEEEKNVFTDEAGASNSNPQSAAGGEGRSIGPKTTEPKRLEPRPIEQIRAEIAAKVKPDPQGKVLVQYFFRPTDKLNQEMIKKVAELAWEYRDVPKVGFVGFTIDRMSKNEIDSIASRLPMILPIRSGSDFAERLGIKRSPAVVMVSATTGEAHILSGKQDKVYLQEFIKRLHGRAQ